MEKIPVAFAAEADRDNICGIAAEIGVEVVFGEPDAGISAPFLRLDADGLSLCGDGMILRGDFSRMLPRLGGGNLKRELLVKAATVRGLAGTPRAVDATAGLGEDSFLLAAAGFSVMLYEYNPTVAALLRDAMRRAALLPETAEIIGRMELFCGDCTDALPRLETVPDVVYLDPMFPQRQKSALVKKKFQLLHGLEPPCCDEEALIRAAISAHPRRIVVKRPSNAPFLGGIKPSYTINGNGIRFDCLVIST